MNQQQITYSQTFIHQGGLMRCCIATISQFVIENGNQPIEDGKTLDCTYETPDKQGIILDSRAWRWNKKEDPK